MPSASSLFLWCFCCRKLLLEKCSELDKNLRGFFIGQMKTGAKRATQGAAHRPGATCCRGPGSTRGWDLPCPMGHLSGASDAYKIIPDEKTLTPEGFSQKRNRALPPSPTSFGGQIVPFPASCRDGDRPPEAISINTAASRDEEGVVPRQAWGLYK